MTEPSAQARGGRERAVAWHDLAVRLAEDGERPQALVAARTSLALLERSLGPLGRTPSHDRTGADEGVLAATSLLVAQLADGDLVPLSVGVPAEAGPGDDVREGRAMWLGAPADPVMAMLGWVERDGGLQVLRVVVPGTRRGRSAFGLLLVALPRCVPVSLLLPARDRGVRRDSRRTGFVEDPGGIRPGGYLGGSITVSRPAVTPPGGGR